MHDAPRPRRGNWKGSRCNAAIADAPYGRADGAHQEAGGRKRSKQVEALSHAKTAARRNIPTAELPSAAERQEEMDPVAPVRYPRPHRCRHGVVRERDEDLDPQIIWNGARIRLTKEQMAQLKETGEVEIGDAQLVWRGKDRQDWSDLVVNAPPLYIQEKVHPQGDHRGPGSAARRTRAEAEDEQPAVQDLFADFNGLDDPEARTEFYQHSQHWSNRMILGDSLQVMASLAEREGLRGQGAVHLFRPALRHQVQLQLAGVDAVARREGRQADGHLARAGAGEGVPRHLEGRHPLLPHLSARSAHRGARPAARERQHLRADRRRECASRAGTDG